MTNLERVSIKRTDLDNGAIDYEIQFRTGRTGSTQILRFEISKHDALEHEKVAEGMAISAAGALMKGYQLGLVAARAAPEIPLEPTEAEIPTDWRKAWMEKWRKQDSAEGFRDLIFDPGRMRYVYK
jgi:hypothetical protein